MKKSALACNVHFPHGDLEPGGPGGVIFNEQLPDDGLYRIRRRRLHAPAARRLGYSYADFGCGFPDRGAGYALG